MHFQVIHSSPRTESKFEGSMANQNVAVGNSLVVWELQGFPCSSNGKESACDAGDHGLIPGLGSSSGEENGSPFQYSCLENSIDREAWLQRVGHD